MSNVYDYVICGAGTSGCVVAGRLAEDPNATVLLIEAGQDSKDLDSVHMASAWTENHDKETDWNILSNPMRNANDRQIKLTRGKFLGGSSGTNGTFCVRGCKQDYDDWGLDGWSGEEFFRYMSKAETFHPQPWFKANETAHGYSGPLHTSPYAFMAPISQALIDSFVSKGLPYDPDMFTTGENPHGCGHAVRTVNQGVRSTAADFVTKDQARSNITIMIDTLVDKIVFGKDDKGNLRATGVETITNDGKQQIFHAKKEVVVSAGTYCSPTILMRSGIGSKSELLKHDVPCQVDLPGVGKNLMDHIIVWVYYETENEITGDHLIYHGDARARGLALWKESKTGFLSNFPAGPFAFARLDDQLSDSPLWVNAARAPGRDPMGLTPMQPNVEFFASECYGGPKHFRDYPSDGKYAFCLVPELFGARSRGTVTLKSKDPRDNPDVDCNFFDDPLDLLVLAEACRFANEIVMTGAGTKNIVKGSWPPEMKHHSYKTREQWVEVVKNQATTCYHPGGTCAMGKSDNPMAVLDEKLRVRGVAGLRVADCSVMPTLNQGHTQMPAYGIGEKCADLVKEDWK